MENKGVTASPPGSQASPEAASCTASSPSVSIPNATWRDPADMPTNASGLLHLGDSIPDIPHLMVGTRIGGVEAEELGYREYAKYGGWLIWHGRGDDFYVIDVDEPRGWMPLEALPNTFPPRAVAKVAGHKDATLARVRAASAMSAGTAETPVEAAQGEARQRDGEAGTPNPIRPSTPDEMGDAQ